MFSFLGYKLANGTTVLIGEQAVESRDGKRKQYAITTNDSDGNYTRNLNNVVVGQVWIIDNRNGEQIDDAIEFDAHYYNYNDSTHYADTQCGIRVPAADLVGGEWVSLHFTDITDGNVVKFADYIKSFN